MSTDESHRSSSSSLVILPEFPGEEVLSHEGRIWKMAAITKLAAEDLMAVAETGRPPALAEIVDVDIADFPE